MSEDIHLQDQALFNEYDQQQIDIKHKENSKRLRKIPWLVFCWGIAVLCLLLGLLFEYEIIYRIFQYLSDGNDYWSPALMATSALLITLAFHILVKFYGSRNLNFWIRRLATFCIPIYVLGAAFLLAAILYQDGLGAILESEQDWLGGFANSNSVGQDSPSEEGWLTTVIEHILNPLAVLGFMLGIGGLAIINLFNSHHWIQSLGDISHDLFATYGEVRHFYHHYHIIQQCNDDIVMNYAELHMLKQLHEDQLILNTALEVVNAIQDALQPHKNALNVHRYQMTGSDFQPVENLDIKAIQKDITRLDNISLSEIEKMLKPYKTRV